MSQKKWTSKIRKICLSFPDAIEDEKWGNPHFCVNKKIFAGCGEEKGTFALGCKLVMEHAKRLITRPGIWKAPYVGHKGWVSIDPSIVNDWDWIAELIHESYCLIAPRKSLEKLESGSRPVKKVAAKKKVAARKKVVARKQASPQSKTGKNTAKKKTTKKKAVSRKTNTGRRQAK